MNNTERRSHRGPLVVSCDDALTALTGLLGRTPAYGRTPVTHTTGRAAGAEISGRDSPSERPRQHQASCWTAGNHRTTARASVGPVTGGGTAAVTRVNLRASDPPGTTSSECCTSNAARAVALSTPAVPSSADGAAASER
jgi:hypothetical protein